MYEIISKQRLNDQYRKVEVKADEISAKFLPGQFIRIAVDENALPMPVSTVDVDPVKGSVVIIFNESDPRFTELSKKKIGDSIAIVQGPLANPFAFGEFKKVLCIGSGAFNVNNLTFCRALSNAGSRVIGVGAYQTKSQIFLESQFRANCDDSVIVTHDGSYDRKGNIIDIVKEVALKQTPDAMIVSANLEVLQNLSQIAKDMSIPCYVNLASILDYGLRHNYRSVFRISGEPLYLGFSEIVRESSTINLQELIDQQKSLEEYNNCQHLINRQTMPPSRSKTFTKLLTGLLKRKP